MKVLHVLDSLRVGGSESLAASLAGAFRETGVDGLVCGLGEDGPLRGRLDFLGVPSLSLGMPLNVRPKAMARLGWLMYAERCNAVITHHFRQLVHAVPGATLLRRRLVHVEHDHHSHENSPRILAHFRRLAPLVSRFVFVSEAIRDWYVKRVPELGGKALAIPNGVDTARFSRNDTARLRVRTLIQAGPEDFVVGTCARLEPVKDLELLLRGFALLLQREREQGRAARLVLVGAGSLLDSLRSLAARLGIADVTHFAGVVDDVPGWLSGLDAYAVTSLNEGLPLSVMEAMSCHLPVLATNVGSMERLVDSQVGLLLHGRDPGELADGLGLLASRPFLRSALGQKARERIVQTHSLHAMVRHYLLALGINQVNEESA